MASNGCNGDAGNSGFDGNVEFSGTVYAMMDVDGEVGNGLTPGGGGAVVNSTNYYGGSARDAIVFGGAPTSTNPFSAGRNMIGIGINGEPNNGFGGGGVYYGLNSMGFPAIPISGNVFTSGCLAGDLSVMHGWGGLHGGLRGGARPPNQMSMDQFRVHLRQRRKGFGFNQEQVAAQMNGQFASSLRQHISYGIVSRFELGQMTDANMSFYRGHFERWIELAESGQFHVPGPLQFKAKAAKTNFTEDQVRSLMNWFRVTKGYPTNPGYTMIATENNLPEQVTRNWFTNHRRDHGLPE